MALSVSFINLRRKHPSLGKETRTALGAQKENEDEEEEEECPQQKRVKVG